MKVFLFAALICCTALQTFAQENTLIWNEAQPLQWFDFSGLANNNSPYAAESFAEIKYTYIFKSPTDFYFEVFANFNRSTSWSKKEYQTQALLKHEQLHFDIAALYSKKLKEAFQGYYYSNDYSYEIQMIFNQKKIEYHLMQKQYDEETNHSLNKEKQDDWEKFISEQLRVSSSTLNYAKK
ncbi:MAG: hypothetical protein M3040_09500 [Bacteroidota bacterium]|nr:hypothetical protein [Bacteroidota bacterium]